MRNIEPDVIFIGGDVSYDDGLRRCYYSWDSYLNMWENELFKPLNRTLPFVFALGNHGNLFIKYYIIKWYVYKYSIIAYILFFCVFF